MNYIEGWKKSHYKEGRGWCNMRAQQDWVSKKFIYYYGIKSGLPILLFKNTLNISKVECYARYDEILDLLFLLIIVGQVGCLLYSRYAADF